MTRLKKTVNDLQTLRPDLSDEWDYERNGDLKPDMITTGSPRKVNWICKEGHRWSASVHKRCSGHGCHYCSGRLPIVGVNDLATTNPELAEEWDYDNNNGLRPEDVLAGSGKKINWIGKKCGHKWKAAIYNRIKGTGCPYCSGRVAISGVNDLATTNPKLAKEWDYENNNGLKPEDVMANSGRKVNWKCEKGHRWSA